MTNIRPEHLNASIRDIRLPDLMRDLPVDRRGYPVPFFATMLDGEWNFLVVQPEKTKQAVRQKRCWVCGKPLGRRFAFVSGPMCVITKTSSEPPCHQSCADYAAVACPFLANPRMRRNEAGLPPEHVPAPGQPIMRNPGVCAVLSTDRYDIFNDEQGRGLIRMGPPLRVDWYAERRRATLEEVLDSMRGGMGLLKDACDAETGVIEQTLAHQELARQVKEILPWLPRD